MITFKYLLKYEHFPYNVDIPEAVKKFTLSRTAVSITVEFLPGWNGGSSQKFTIEYKEVDDIQGKKIQIPDPELSIIIAKKLGDSEGIKPDTQYSVRVWATNMRGEGPRTPWQDIRTKSKIFASIITYRQNR